MSKGDPKHASELQKKIFGRWVKLKLSIRHVNFNDVLKDLSDGLNLITLLEVLSDKEYQNKKKLVLNPKMRPQILDNCSQALGFCWEVGVEMKLKPSAENLADGNETMVLGLLWSIMLKFMKFGDEEDEKALNARDALLMWVQNQVVPYPNVKVENMTKSFHDGLAFCALIHKFRPKLIPYEKLDASHSEDNLKLAFAAAEKFFNLEQYLTPADIPLLDEKSMVVYVSEYYYGIAQQRKVDLAARRITKVIKFTKEMDAKKADYVARSKQLRIHVDGVAKLLNDRTIDNTMAGAKKKLEDFYGYKSNDKGVITDTYLSIESVFNQLALKLADNRRPPFNPETGCSIPELRQTLSELEVVEKERKVALHAELNRQVKLAKTYELHGERYAGFELWNSQKTQYLETKEEIHSVGEAEFQLNTLAAYRNEYTAVVETIVVELKKEGTYLRAEKFEFSAEVTQRETKVDEALAKLKSLADAKQLLLDDHLAREKFAEKVRGWNKQHVAKYNKLANFISEKKTYFSFKETVNSVSDANLHLSILAGHHAQQKDLQAAAPRALEALGAQIREAKYETSYSRYVYEDPEGVTGRETTVSTGFVESDRLHAHKLAVLEDDLQREKFKDVYILASQQHLARARKLAAWLQESHTYLNKKELVESIPEAQLQLSLVRAHIAEKKDMYTNNFAALKKLGEEIRSAKYETQYSRWVFEDPESLVKLENETDAGFAVTDEKSAYKLAVLEDDLAREQFKEEIRLKNKQHIDKHGKIQLWIEEAHVYLKKKEAVSSIAEANLQLSRIKTHIVDKKELYSNSFAVLKALGNEILTAKYATQYSSWVFEDPASVTQRETSAEKGFQEADTLAAHKLEVLEDDVARETFAENVRLKNKQHVDKHEKLAAWIKDSVAKLSTKEVVDSIAEANLQLSLLHGWVEEKKDLVANNYRSLCALGKEIVDAKYATKHSSWSLENPEAVQARETELNQGFTQCDQLAQEKDQVLADDLARETVRENLRLKNEQHIDRSTNLKSWVADSRKYLETVDPVDSIPDADTNLLNLEAWNADFADVSAINVSAFKRLGAELLAAKYEGKYSTYTLPADVKSGITQRESDIDADWKTLQDLAEKKKAVLDEDLAREKRKEALRLEFANLAQEFSRWTQDISTSSAKTVFGFTLDEVEAFAATLAALDQGVTADADKKAVAYKKVFDELTSLKVTKNIYTQSTPDSLAQSRAAMEAALQVRKGKFEEELARQRANDKLCKDFAGLVEPFVQRIDAAKDSLANSKKDAEAQLLEVQQKIDESSKDDFGLAQVKALQQELDAKSISDNRHTILTAKDAEVLWQQYLQFLQRKKGTIEEEIAHKRLRGLTEEQMREIELQFQQFDKNKNGSLDRNEFKTCLYSLNEDKTKQEVTQIMEKYGSNGVIRYEGFREFMISVLGDTDTKDEVIEGFRLINKDKPVTDDELMGLVLADDQIAYIKSTAPQKDKGYDYVAWTEEVYAR